MQLYSIKKVKSVAVTLFWISRRMNITLSVPLYRNLRNDKEDRFFYSDFQSYTNGLRMRIDLDWWIYIRSRIDGNINTEYRLCSTNHYQFIQALLTMRSWITTPPNDHELFYYDKDGKVQCDKDFEGVTVMNTFGDKFTMIPTIQEDDSGREMGILIIINDIMDLSVFVTLDKFMNFVFMMETLNPYSMAMELVNFANIRTNDKQDLEDTESITSSGQVIHTAKQSFFTMSGAKERTPDD